MHTEAVLHVCAHTLGGCHGAAFRVARDALTTPRPPPSLAARLRAGAGTPRGRGSHECVAADGSSRLSDSEPCACAWEVCGQGQLVRVFNYVFILINDSRAAFERCYEYNDCTVQVLPPELWALVFNHVCTHIFPFLASIFNRTVFENRVLGCKRDSKQGSCFSFKGSFWFKSGIRVFFGCKSTIEAP